MPRSLCPRKSRLVRRALDDIIPRFESRGRRVEQFCLSLSSWTAVAAERLRCSVRGAFHIGAAGGRILRREYFVCDRDECVKACTAGRNLFRANDRETFKLQDGTSFGPILRCGAAMSETRCSTQTHMKENALHTANSRAVLG